MKAENRGQRVRGCVVVGNGSAGCISKDNPDCIVSYTHWFRHDDDLTELESDLKKLTDLYMSFKKTSSATVFYEYEEYER